MAIMKQTILLLPDPLKEAIRATAAERRISMGCFMRRAIAVALSDGDRDMARARPSPRRRKPVRADQQPALAL